MALVGLRNLCSPAAVYLTISVVALVIILIQSSGNANVYCVGNYSCDTSNLYVVFVLKILYVLVWTWILNLICQSGLSMVSWALVLFPFILMFILIGTFLIFSSSALPLTVPTLLQL
jgi:hypothetical protein